MGAAGISLLGPLAVDAGAGRLAPRDRVVLAALALHRGEVVSAERLADALWGEHPPPSWPKIVPGCVMRLRRALGTEAIATTPHGYRLVVPSDDVDAHRFERLVGRGRELLSLGEPDRAGHVIGEALALWRGHALIDLDRWDDGRIEAARLEELRREAEELRIDAALQAGRCREVLGEAQARAAEEPLRERRWALLALAQYQSGRQGEALRSLHRARTVLATDLGVDPGPELVGLEQAILRQDPALMARDAMPPASPKCPYLGLVSYDLADSELFFGRDADVAGCLRRIATTRVLAVVGPSGIGKSSVVRAGVAAALEREGSRIVIVTPGAHPADSLAALAVAGPAPVLIVDQCEEAASLCADPAQADRFFAALVDHARRAPLVVTVRADRLSDVSTNPELARLLERGLYLLGPMNEADLRAAIEGPAHQAGLLLEPGLVDLLVREVEGERGALPLLSHALGQTWARREGRTLTVAGYRQSGGIRGAVAQTAEDIYDRIPPEQRPNLRNLMLRLMTPADDEPVATPLPRRTIVAGSEQERLVEMLVDARLVTSDDGVVELAHESLARAWPRLRGWLEEDVEGQRIFRHLVAAADAWDAMGRPDTELYRGVRLTQALEWRDRSPAGLTPTEGDFLAASHQLAEADRQSAEVAARQHRRTRRRHRLLLAGIGVVLALVVIAGLTAIRQGRRADTATAAADARRAVAAGSATEELDLSLLLAVEAMRLDDSPDTRANLLAALSRNPAMIAYGHHDVPIEGLAVHPETGAVAIGGAYGGVAMLDGETLDPVSRHDESPWLLTFRPDGGQLAVATTADVDPGTSPAPESGPVVLVNPATFEPEPVQLGGVPAGSVADVDYSGDGRFLAAAFGGDDGDPVVMVWEVGTPRLPVMRVSTGEEPAVALTPDGSVVYVATQRPRALSAYEVSTGRALGMVDLSLAEPSEARTGAGLDLSPDGATLAVAEANEVVLFDAAGFAEVRRLQGHVDPIVTLEFSHDGASVAAGSGRRVLVWDAGTGARREDVRGHNDAVSDVAFSPNDGTLYSTSADRAVVGWDLLGDRSFLPRTGLVDVGFAADARPLIAPDGAAVAFVSTRPRGDSDEIRFLDVESGRLGEAVAVGRDSTEPSWRPSGSDHVAIADAGGHVRVWDWRRGAIVAERQVIAGSIASLAYTADGTRLLVGEGSAGPSLSPGALHQLDADSLDRIGESVPLDYDVEAIAASPDGRTAAVLFQGEVMSSIDLVTGEVAYEKYLGFGSVSAGFSPDGRLLAIVCEFGLVAVIDADTGEWVQPPWGANGHHATRVVYAPDGDTFVTSGSSGERGNVPVQLWDGRGGEPRGEVVQAIGAVRADAVFRSDGHTLVVATAGGGIYTWDTRPERWIDHACAVAGRSLTHDEWRDVFGRRPYRATCA